MNTLPTATVRNLENVEVIRHDPRDYFTIICNREESDGWWHHEWNKFELSENEYTVGDKTVRLSIIEDKRPGAQEVAPGLKFEIFDTNNILLASEKKTKYCQPLPIFNKICYTIISQRDLYYFDFEKIFFRRIIMPGAKEKIKEYLLSHVGEEVTRDTLRQVSGNVQDWPRSLRTLRQETGLDIVATQEGYILTSATPVHTPQIRKNIDNKLKYHRHNNTVPTLFICAFNRNL